MIEPQKLLWPRDGLQAVPGPVDFAERVSIMAEVFRPVYYVNPTTGKCVPKSFPGAVKRKSKTWWIRYYLPNGQRLKAKGFRDKKATENRAAELERRGIRQDAGIVEPADEHARRPLCEHAEDFRRYLAAKGNTALYVQLVLFRLTAVLDECRFVRIADFQASAVIEFLAHLREGGKSTKTANEYLAAAKGFTRWLWRDRRIAVDPLACLSKLAHAAADIRHARRDFTCDELRWLLETARTSARLFRRLSGLDRYTIYLTAAATGFRTSELASMTPESFDLDGDTPTATVEAACTKNRRLAVQPLPLDVANVMREYLDGKSAGQPVWPGTWGNDASAKMIRRDLADTRGAWLQSFQDERQRDEMSKSDFLGLPRLPRPCNRLPRIAAYVHHDGRQGRRFSAGAYGPSPPFFLRHDRPLFARTVLRPRRSRAIVAPSDEWTRPAIADHGRHGDRWRPKIPWPKPWPAIG
jgi:site-specific recombinase XerC